MKKMYPSDPKNSYFKEILFLMVHISCDCCMENFVLVFYFDNTLFHHEDKT